MKTPLAFSLALIFIAAPAFAQTTITPTTPTTPTQIVPTTPAFPTAPAITTTPNAVSGFNQNPVSGFTPNPVGGFASGPVSGYTTTPFTGFNTNTMGTPFQFAPLTTTPSFPSSATNSAVTPVFPNSPIFPQTPSVAPVTIPNSITGTNQTPLF